MCHMHIHKGVMQPISRTYPFAGYAALLTLANPKPDSHIYLY